MIQRKGVLCSNRVFAPGNWVGITPPIRVRLFWCIIAIRQYHNFNNSFSSVLMQQNLSVYNSLLENFLHNINFIQSEYMKPLPFIEIFSTEKTNYLNPDIFFIFITIALTICEFFNPQRVVD
ncbi:Uncharacterised protein [Yersinia wautersii]|uniref:Uncharacterized protein n=1 Tax=Yersinia wautersii TaxID=1341643 RepID=A0ABM9TFU7_9GAMM|nr:Uncharacterised protein [Yersinia wautersii]